MPKKSEETAVVEEAVETNGEATGFITVSRGTVVGQDEEGEDITVQATITQQIGANLEEAIELFGPANIFADFENRRKVMLGNRIYSCVKRHLKDGATAETLQDLVSADFENWDPYAVPERKGGGRKKKSLSARYSEASPEARYELAVQVYTDTVGEVTPEIDAILRERAGLPAA